MKITTHSRFPGRPVKRLTLFMSVQDRLGHNSLEMELLKRARKAELAGATVFEGDEGFGASGQLHREHLIADDRPLAVVFIDEPDKIDAFLHQVGPLLHDVVVTFDDIELLDL